MCPFTDTGKVLPFDVYSMKLAGFISREAFGEHFLQTQIRGKPPSLTIFQSLHGSSHYATDALYTTGLHLSSKQFRKRVSLASRVFLLLSFAIALSEVSQRDQSFVDVNVDSVAEKRF